MLLVLVVLVFIAVAALPADAAVAYRVASMATTGTLTATSLTVPKPTGTAINDVMIASLGVNGGTGVTLTPPGGWSLIRRDNSTTSLAKATYYKVVSTTDTNATGYTFTFGATARKATGGIISYSGVSKYAPINISGGQANASGTAMTAPAVTTTVANTQIVALYSASNTTTVTAGSSMTERYDVNNTGGTATTNTTTQAQDIAQAAAGASGTKSATLATAGVNIGHTIALTPSVDIDQPAYRWYANADAVQPGSALANENTPIVSQSSTPLRLRMGLQMGTGSSLTASSKNFRLQQATSQGGPWRDVANPGVAPLPDDKLPNPATLPSGTSNANAFSPDGTYLAVAGNTTPTLFSVYKRSGDTFTKLTDPATLPASSVEDFSWSSDGTYLSIGLSATPFIAIYKRSGDTFTKLTDPATLPANSGYSMDFSNDDVYLSVAHPTTPFVTIYKRSGDTFTKLANPATLPAQTPYGTAFSADTTYLALSLSTTPFIAIYKRSGDTFTKLTDPAALPTGIGQDVAWSSDGTYVSVAHTTSPYITNYQRINDTFIKQSSPTSLPASDSYAASYSTDGTYLAVSHGTTPFLTIYKTRPIVWKFKANATPADGATVSSALLTGTPALQSYAESNPTVNNPNALASAQRGEWDFSLDGSLASSGKDYYFRLVGGDDVPLTSYAAYPRVTVDDSVLGQAGYRFYDQSSLPASTTFARTVGSTGEEFGDGTVHTADGGYAVTGYTLSYANAEQLYIAKYDKNGDQVFFKTWGTTGDEGGRGIIQTSDGGYAVSGYTSSSGGGGYDVLLIKFDSAGDFVFARTWGGTGTDTGDGLIQTSDGGYALTGYSGTTAYTAGGNDILLLKFDSDGTVKFSTLWGGAAADFGVIVIETADGGYAVVSQTLSFADPDGDIVFVKYNSAGAISFVRTWGGTLADNSWGVVQTSDGGYVLGGFYTNTTSSSIDAFLLKIDSVGDFVAARGWDDGSTEDVHSITGTVDGGVAIGGSTNATGAGDFDMLLMKFDSSLNLGFARTIGGTAKEQVTAIQQTGDGGYVISGDSMSNSAGLNDLMIAKFDSTGSIAGCSAPTCQTPSGTLSTTPLGTFSEAGGTVRVNAPATMTNVATQATVSQTPSTTLLYQTAGAIGTPLAASNTAANVSSAELPFRLRGRVSVDGGLLRTSGSDLKLQFKEKSAGVCDATQAGYTDLTTSSSPLAYYDSSSQTDSVGIASTATDPVNGSRPAVTQSYRESNPFGNNTSAVPVGSDGLWDFSLTSAAPALGKTYCLRLVKSDNSLLASYSQVPEATIGTIFTGPTLDQQLRGGQSVRGGIKDLFSF
jgi:hypothetical protein